MDLDGADHECFPYEQLSAAPAGVMALGMKTPAEAFVLAA